ncbi:ribonuclease H [Senna tora]|uniref:Ribonuclease H n=1 Tax=Senna tora TaxID=362788 RepID=A0A834TJY5_9FABA|nr:ribonuclease H [Senna tora]
MRGSCNILVAEMWGIVHGLELAWNLGHRRVIVEADSLVAVNMIKQGCSASHPCSSLVQRAHTWINRDWHIFIQHSFREGNRVADRLAAEGHKLPIGVHILVDPPDFIVDLLLEDSQERERASKFLRHRNPSKLRIVEVENRVIVELAKSAVEEEFRAPWKLYRPSIVDHPSQVICIHRSVLIFTVNSNGISDFAEGFGHNGYGFTNKTNRNTSFMDTMNNAFEIELWGILNGLTQASALGVLKLMVNRDLPSAISAISKSRNGLLSSNF